MHIKQNDNTGLREALRGLNIKSLSLSQSILTHLESFSQSLLLLTRLEYLSIQVDECPDVWEALCSLNIKSLKLRQSFLNHVQSLSHSLSSLKQLEFLSIKVYKCPSLLKALRGLTIKGLTLSCWVDCLKANDAESLSQSLSSLTKLESLSINVLCLSHDFLEDLHGLNIKSLTLSWWNDYLNVNHVESSSQSLKSLKKLETLSIRMCEVFHGLNIASLTLSYWDDCLGVNNTKSLSQSLSSLKQLQTLTIYVRIFINIQLPQSLKYLNIYCTSLLPSELRELKDTLYACTQTVETNVEFAAYDDDVLEAIQLEDYIAIKQELETLKIVAVKRFRIFDKINKNNYIGNDDAEAWSVRDIGGVDEDDQDIENVTNHQKKNSLNV
ncbi:hypothetical protein DPMN_141602 [Dreissena polymorpha]|uniref:Uncharacterized protein n=1 Tax=Dreissena polymorpha TaxID=45954 RepID=A0A9D4G9P1_DREPO|nr:hypothetical protein DPMN_141602 [Dreissena polymorpha]